MAKTADVVLTYVGPFDAVEVLGVEVARGAPVTFPSDVAGLLLEQVDNWSKEQS